LRGSTKRLWRRSITTTSKRSRRRRISSRNSIRPCSTLMMPAQAAKKIISSTKSPRKRCPKGKMKNENNRTF